LVVSICKKLQWVQYCNTSFACMPPWVAMGCQLHQHLLSAAPIIASAHALLASCMLDRPHKHGTLHLRGVHVLLALVQLLLEWCG
jgi:hypothetical protein